jgi:Putative transposase/Transposase zinc-binding domain
VGAHPQRADAARVKVELAEVLERFGATYCATHALVPVQYRALRAVAACRTAALGGQLAQCDACGAQRYVYHSCRNRHCPKCQTLAKERWLAARRRELLPVPYFHLVFTLPHELNTLAQGNPAQFESVSATLIEFGANARWLGGEIAATLILHTWGQTLTQHLHLHCLVAAGALHADGHWVRSHRGFLFPVQALSQVFRGKFLAALTRAFDTHALSLAGVMETLAQASARQRLFCTLREKPWVVYAKRPFGGPQQVLDYLGRYTHRVALSNDRILSTYNGEVTFSYRDRKNENRKKTMTLDAHEFIRRFLLHVIPKGFVRVRHFGFLANRSKSLLSKCRRLLDLNPALLKLPSKSVHELMLQFTGIDITRCPLCQKGTLVFLADLPVPAPWNSS